MQRKHLTWLGSEFSAVHAEQVHGGGGAGALLVRSPRLDPDELDTQEVMLSARDRPDDEPDPAGAGMPSFWRRYDLLSFHERCSPHSKYGM